MRYWMWVLAMMWCCSCDSEPKPAPKTPAPIKERVRPKPPEPEVEEEELEAPEEIDVESLISDEERLQIKAAAQKEITPKNADKILEQMEKEIRESY